MLRFVYAVPVYACGCGFGFTLYSMGMFYVYDMIDLVTGTDADRREREKNGMKSSLNMIVNIGSTYNDPSRILYLHIQSLELLSSLVRLFLLDRSMGRSTLIICLLTQ